MNETILGQKLTDEEVKNRDAIHIAVAPVRANNTLMPGEHIGFVDNTNINVGSKVILETKFIGIVDPFLKEPVLEGEWFYMLLYPKTITSLKHVWSHPEFSDEPNKVINEKRKVASEIWLKAYADQYGGSYHQMMQAIIDKGQACFSCDLEYEDFSNYDSTFWRHVENVLVRKLDNNHKEAVSFSCAC